VLADGFLIVHARCLHRDPVVAPFTSRPRDAAGMVVAKIIYQTLRNRDSVAIYTYKNCNSFGGGTTLCDMSSCYWTHGWGSYHRLSTNSLTGVRFSIEGVMTTIKVVRFFFCLSFRRPPGTHHLEKAYPNSGVSRTRVKICRSSLPHACLFVNLFKRTKLVCGAGIDRMAISGLLSITTIRTAQQPL
jgi:hypothetical protein